MQVKRINLTAGAETKFEFDVLAREFCVKNFTDGDILVSLGDTFDEETSIKIPTMFAETISDNFNTEYTKYTTKQYNCVTIKSDLEGEVEVQCVE